LHLAQVNDAASPQTLQVFICEFAKICCDESLAYKKGFPHLSTSRFANYRCLGALLVMVRVGA
jgi:hypothetical protein